MIKDGKYIHEDEVKKRLDQSRKLLKAHYKYKIQSEVAKSLFEGLTQINNEMYKLMPNCDFVVGLGADGYRLIYKEGADKNN